MSIYLRRRLSLTNYSNCFPSRNCNRSIDFLGERFAVINSKTSVFLSQVSIVAASTCRYLYWQRSALEYLFVKETYIATVLTTLIARDITTKLYAMNNKIVTAKGSHLDIRLPSITSSLTSGGEYKSPIRKKPNGCS